MSPATHLADVLTGLLILAGGGFALIGSIGLARLPTLMTRLHAPTKATTLGVGSSLVASMIHFAALRGLPSAHELLVALFLFITAPVSANMIAKAHLHRRASGLEPVHDSDDVGGVPAPSGASWATFGSPPASGAPGGTAARDPESAAAEPSQRD